jgi:hypothetical protein
MLGAVAASLLIAGPCRAERELVPLGRLLAESSRVVVGEVVAVADEGTAKEVATVDVAAVLAGPGAPGGDLPVAGAPTDPEGHAFAAGQRLLLFLESPLPTRPGIFRITEGAGVFGLPAGDPSPVGELVLAARDHGGRVPMALLLPYLEQGGPRLSPGLLAATLEQLALVADPADAGQADALVGLACGSTPAVHPIVQRWAIGHVGRLRLEAARPCLAALVTVPRRRRNTPFPVGDRILQTAAVDSLVLLGGRESVDALQATVSSLSRFFGPCEPNDLLTAAVHALGVLAANAEPVRSRIVGKVALKSPSTAVTSTAVYALGLIGDTSARSLLRRLSLRHDNPLIRNQALETLARLGQ